VGDDEHRPASRRQVMRQPVDGFDVEMIGRLVEQQQLGAVEQQSRDRDPPALAAGQGRDRRVHAVAEAAQLHAAEQPVEHRSKRAVRRPLVVRAPADERVANRRVLVELVALAKQGQPEIPDACDLPGVRSLGARDQAQERRLAVAVAADDSDPLIGRDTQRDVPQHRPAAVALADGLQVDEVAGGSHLRAPLCG
jgi:hypothetical protein